MRVHKRGHEMLKEEFVELLRSIRLDKVYHKGLGNRLWYHDDQGKEIEVLDMVGGFGSTILGHNHPELKRVIHEFLDRDYPINTQGSVKRYSSELADRLSDLASRGADHQERYRCILTNSGAETVEAAIEHAELHRIGKLEALRKQINHALGTLNNLLGDQMLRWTEETPDYFGTRGIPVPSKVEDLKEALTEVNKTALEHAPVFLALRNSFHGKTTGAVQLTFKKEYRKGFEALGPKTVFFDPREFRFIDRAIRDLSQEVKIPRLNPDKTVELSTVETHPISGFILEPIQGEGGIRFLGKEALDHFQKCCQEHQIPLIFDEIQSGMGRTGAFLASREMGVEGDYILLSKSLGGGILKIGALLIRESKYVKEFSLIQTSTFAEDELTSRVSLKALELLFDDDSPLMRRCIEKGRLLRKRLEELRSEFPDILREIRGKGLMIGIEFQDFHELRSDFLRGLSDSGSFVSVLAGYLLHEHRIRVLPTLNDTGTMRLEPSVFISNEEIDRFLTGMKTLCQALRAQHGYALLRFLVNDDREDIQFSDTPSQIQMLPQRYQKTTQADHRIGFLVHYIDYQSLDRADKTLARLSTRERARLFDRIQCHAKPMDISTLDITSKTGKKVQFNGFGLPLSSEQIIGLLKSGRGAWLLEKVQESVDYAISRGWQLVGLGQFTSIISKNGLAIQRDNIGLTTGNSLTAALGADAVLKQQEPRKVLAAIGAAGNVCEGYVKVLAPQFEKVTLIGNKRSRSGQRLEEIAHELNHPCVEIAEDLSTIQDADVIVSATSSERPILLPGNLKEKALVCDISVPRDVHPDVYKKRKDVRVIHGGVVRLPHREETYMFGLPFSEPGMIYACMAETILLGMRGMNTNFSFGPLDVEKMQTIRDIFYSEGFELITDVQ
jgi:acetylornithine/succinyldiaminopimelate/putrescine aminotransferase/predicted amino acid dehydrogenase